MRNNWTDLPNYLFLLSSAIKSALCTICRDNTSQYIFIFCAFIHAHAKCDICFGKKKLLLCNETCYNTHGIGNICCNKQKVSEAKPKAGGHAKFWWHGMLAKIWFCDNQCCFCEPVYGLPDHITCHILINQLGNNPWCFRTLLYTSLYTTLPKIFYSLLQACGGTSTTWPERCWPLASYIAVRHHNVGAHYCSTWWLLSLMKQPSKMLLMLMCVWH